MSAEAGGFVVSVDKPAGPTSHDIVSIARRALHIRRVGHTGTLDPFASGLLLLCVGHATRLAEYLSALDKCYEAVARLGVTTDTLDRDGEIVSEYSDWTEVEEGRIREALKKLRGTIEQVPPQFSAKKVDGEAMHRRARRGERVELAPSTVTVHDIELLSIDLPEVRFRVRCSSGTYIRSIARDLGESLGVGAHLTVLRRTAIGSFQVEDALGIEELEDRDEIQRVAVGPLDAVRHLPALEIDDDDARRLVHGQRIRLSDDGAVGPVAVSHGGTLLAIAEVDDGVLKPRKVFAA
jgi:tRNA pseudouridine55 synthase